MKRLTYNGNFEAAGTGLDAAANPNPDRLAPCFGLGNRVVAFKDVVLGAAVAVEVIASDNADYLLAIGI